MTPDGVSYLVADGHDVLVEEGAGEGAGYTDDLYEDAGADLVDADEAWDADLVVKIKEPLTPEYGFLDDDTTLFTYLHLAADEDLTEELLDSGTTAIAYETVEDDDGDNILLEPMSRVAGEMAPTMGEYHMSRHNDGKGVMLSGIEGEEPGTVTVVGGGTVGEHAARKAANMGADVTVYEVDEERMEELETVLPDDAAVAESIPDALEDAVPETDLLVGAVLVPGAEAPKVVTEDMVADMEDGSVVVDVAVDQGGCVATTRTTRHSQETYTEHGVVHYAVANMPGAYARTATDRLTDATLPYIRDIAEHGWEEALREDDGLRKGLQVADGEITYERVAAEFDLDWTDPDDML